VISRRYGIYLLLGFALVIAAAAFFAPRIPQPQYYHNFADQRAWLGVPNFGNVASNALFAIAGTLGLIVLCRKQSRSQFVDSRERWPYILFFLGLLLTAWGSSYYHLAPGNARLEWDRLPMTIAFAALVAAVIAERISVQAGLYLLPLLILTGASSVVLWKISEAQGAGDLRFYAAVQVCAVFVLPIALLLPPRYNRGSDFAVVFGLYVLAKIFETADRQIFSVGHVVSGHTLKHLAAGAAGFWILRMIEKRRVFVAQCTL